MARFWRGAGCAVVLTVMAIAPAARAQGAGLQVDAGSPSATEYQLPLERARRDAQQSGPPKKVRPGERTAPAFGEGIQQPATPPTAPHNEGLNPGGATEPTAAKRRTSAPGRARTVTAERPAPAPADDGGATHTVTVAAPAIPPPPSSRAAGGPGNSLLGVGAIAAGVLALGAGLGLLLRRRARAG